MKLKGQSIVEHPPTHLQDDPWLPGGVVKHIRGMVMLGALQTKFGQTTKPEQPVTPYGASMPNWPLHAGLFSALCHSCF